MNFLFNLKKYFLTLKHSKTFEVLLKSNDGFKSIAYVHAKPNFDEQLKIVSMSVNSLQKTFHTGMVLADINRTMSILEFENFYGLYN